MSYTEQLRRFTAELRRNPMLPAPDVVVRTAQDMTEWKEQSRAYDAARIALGLVTPAVVQRENSCVRVDRSVARILQWPAFDV